MSNRLFLISLFLLIMLPLSSRAENPKILLFVPEENPRYLVSDLALKTEAGAMIEFLEAAGYKVDIATPSGNPIVVGMTSLKPDHKFSEVIADNYVGLILPSVNAHHREPISSEAVKVIRQFVEQDKPIAAQAYGIEWLGEAGLLLDREFSFVSAAVNSYRLKSKIKDGILIDNRPIVKDGNIITSGVSPDISQKFDLHDGTLWLTKALIEEITDRQ